jgi:hypothetical protein
VQPLKWDQTYTSKITSSITFDLLSIIPGLQKKKKKVGERFLHAISCHYVAQVAIDKNVYKNVT